MNYFNDENVETWFEIEIESDKDVESIARLFIADFVKGVYIQCNKRQCELPGSFDSWMDKISDYFNWNEHNADNKYKLNESNFDEVFDMMDDLLEHFVLSYELI